MQCSGILGMDRARGPGTAQDSTGSAAPQAQSVLSPGTVCPRECAELVVLQARIPSVLLHAPVPRMNLPGSSAGCAVFLPVLLTLLPTLIQFFAP